MVFFLLRRMTRFLANFAALLARLRHPPLVARSR